MAVQEGDEKPYSCSSGYYRRLDAVSQKMTQGEIRSIFRETTDARFEDLPRKDFSLEDISIKKIKAFLKEAKTSYQVSKANLIPLLTTLGVYKDHRMNNAGVLMFAAETRKFIPYSEIILAAFKGTDKRFIYDRKDVRDDLFTQLNEAMAFIQKQLNVRSEIRGFDRHDIYEIPLDALREGVLNALIHRDYSIRGTSVYVGVYDDRVEIENPGGLVAGITKENFGKSSIRRNPIIADLFHRMGKVERMGSGIKKMKDLMREAGLKPPAFETENFFRAFFYRDSRYALKSSPISEGVNEGVSEGVERLRKTIKENPGKRVPYFEKTFNVPAKTLERWLRQLKKQKKITFKGSPKMGGYWET